MQRSIVHIMTCQQDVGRLAYAFALYDPAGICHAHKTCGAGNLVEWVRGSLFAQVVNKALAIFILLFFR